MSSPDMHIWGFSHGPNTTLDNISKAISYIPFLGIIANLWKKVQKPSRPVNESLNTIDPNKYHRTTRAVLECIPGVSTFLLPVDLIATIRQKMTSELHSLEKSLEAPKTADDLNQVLQSLNISLKDLGTTQDPKILYVAAFLNRRGRMLTSNGESLSFTGSLDDALPYYFGAFDAIAAKEKLTPLEEQMRKKILNELKEIATGKGITNKNNVTNARSFFHSHGKNPLIEEMINKNPWLTDMQLTDMKPAQNKA